MELYKKVRLACAEGISARAAAKHFNISRGTVEKMLSFSVPPGYRREKPIKRPKLDGFTEIIDSWLEADKVIQRKQRHTAKRIWERLQAEHGFTGGYTIVKDYVRERERRTREMFVPLAHPPGHAQADFGEAVVVIGGVEQKAQVRGHPPVAGFPDRRRGHRPDRPALRRREGSPRVPARYPGRASQGPCSPGLRRPGAMAGHATHHDLRQIPARGRHPLCPDPHGAPAPLPRQRQLYHDQVRIVCHSKGADNSMPDNNAAERGMRAIALGRKNYLFVGSEAGGKAAAIAYTLIETAKLNAVDPHAWLADTLARIPDYKITKVDDLLPWKWRA